jgi:uncharacterized protein YbaA (DUF1428 family)
MTMAIETVQKPSRTWLGVCAATVLVLLVGAFVWWEFRTPANSAELDVGNVPASARMRSQIQSDGKGDWNIWSSPALLYVSAAPANQFNVDVRSRGMVSDDMRNLVIMAIRVGRDHKAAQAINATKDQVAKVRDLQFPRAVVSAEDLSTLKKLWSDYQAASDADKLNAKIALLNGLHTVGDNSIAPTKKLWTDAAAVAKSTFSADQIKKFQQYERNGQRPNPLATSRPSNRPAKPTSQATK